MADGPPAPEPPGVVLVLQGSAFTGPTSREEAASVVAARTGRRMHVVTEEPTLERTLQTAASRVERTVARSARTEARASACRKKTRSVALATAERADVVLRVRLDVTAASRPATDADRTALRATSQLAGMLSAVGLGGDDTVFVTTLAGTVERATFPGTTAIARQRVRFTAERLGRRDAPPAIPVREAIEQALASLPPSTPARWDAIARGLVSSGCPVLATAVAETFLDDVAAKRRIRAAATGVLAGATRHEEPSAEPTEAAATAVPAVELPADAPAKPADPAYSCTQLCTLHMVELCNNDRTLWTQHGSRWETTRCGVRRSETFLEECYRMQWLSGAYEQSCIRPCEETAEGRTRLLTVLRRSGCLRSGG